MKKIFRLITKHTAVPAKGDHRLDIKLIHKGLPITIEQFNTCRGYIWDKLQKHLVDKKFKSNRYFYILGRMDHKYNANLITDDTIRLASDLLFKMGYLPLKVYKEGTDILLRVDIQVLKNLYACSLFFVLFKTSLVIKTKGADLKTIGDVLEHDSGIYCNYKAKRKAIEQMVDNWHEIFPKPLTFNTIYSYGLKSIKTVSQPIHNEGISELSSGATKFKFINDRVQKVKREAKS